MEDEQEKTRDRPARRKVTFNEVGPGGVPVEITVYHWDDGAITYEGAHIGYVWKGERLYSPPLYPGSRVVKYHKRIATWNVSTFGNTSMDWQQQMDTRKRAIQYLLTVHREKQEDASRSWSGPDPMTP